MAADRYQLGMETWRPSRYRNILQALLAERVSEAEIRLAAAQDTVRAAHAELQRAEALLADRIAEKRRLEAE